MRFNQEDLRAEREHTAQRRENSLGHENLYHMYRNVNMFLNTIYFSILGLNLEDFHSIKLMVNLYIIVFYFILKAKVRLEMIYSSNHCN